MAIKNNTWGTPSAMNDFGGFTVGQTFMSPEQKQMLLLQAMREKNNIGGGELIVPPDLAAPRENRDAPMTGADQAAILRAKRQKAEGLAQIQAARAVTGKGVLGKALAAGLAGYMGGKTNANDAAALKETIQAQRNKEEELRLASIDREDEGIARDTMQWNAEFGQQADENASQAALREKQGEYYGNRGTSGNLTSVERNIALWASLPEGEEKELVRQAIARDQWRQTGDEYTRLNDPSGTPSTVDVDLKPEQQVGYLGDAAAAKTTGEAEAEKNFTMRNAIPIIQRAREVLSGEATGTRPTGSGIGQAADFVGRIFGESISGSSEATTMKALGGWLTGKVPRFEGPQSDPDRIYYEQMAAKIGDASFPVEERLAALAEVEGIITGEISLPGGSIVLDAVKSEADTLESLKEKRERLQAELDGEG